MWHGPAMHQTLEGVPAAAAASHPIAGAHSIRELVAHTALWAEIARDRIEGRERRTPSPAEDFPAAPDDGEEGWRGAVERLRESYRALAATAAGLTTADLARSVPTSSGSCSVHELLHGVIEHATYHGGQIALLKRAALGAR